MESAKWIGQCPSCKAWNTMVEEPGKDKFLQVNCRRCGEVFLPAVSVFPWAVNRNAVPVSLSLVEDAGKRGFPQAWGNWTGSWEEVRWLDPWSW